MIWVHKNATKLGIAPNRLAAGGGSAGGHIAACLGCIDPPAKETLSSRPNALFLFNPACVLAPLDDKQAFPKERIKQLKVRMGTNPKNLSPAHHTSKDDPPTIVFHGTADPTVPYATAVTFTQRLKAAGVRCELMSYEGAKHGFFNPRGGNDSVMRKTLTQLDAFLISLNWIEDMSQSRKQESKN
jgi:acetyl esterase/lipase